MMGECWLNRCVEKVLGMTVLINISIALTMTCMICVEYERMRSYDGILENEVVEMKNFVKHTMCFSLDEILVQTSDVGLKSIETLVVL